MNSSRLVIKGGRCDSDGAVAAASAAALTVGQQQWPQLHYPPLIMPLWSQLQRPQGTLVLCSVHGPVCFRDRDFKLP